jgi:hypothetical protein
MRRESKPRIWVGVSMDLPRHWSWSDGHWFPNDTLYAGDIFSTCKDHPTIDPASMPSIETCKEVDW